MQCANTLALVDISLFHHSKSSNSQRNVFRDGYSITRLSIDISANIKRQFSICAKEWTNIYLKLEVNESRYDAFTLHCAFNSPQGSHQAIIKVPCIDVSIHTKVLSVTHKLEN